MTSLKLPGRGHLAIGGGVRLASGFLSGIERTGTKQRYERPVPGQRRQDAEGLGVATNRVTSCGVLVTDVAGLVLVGQASGSARWDIPKGIAEAGESYAEAAVRELWEETGLAAGADAIRPLGVHRYLPGKDLALFGWEAGTIDLAALRCTSVFRGRDGRMVPELSRFAVLTWHEALARVGHNLRRVLEGVGPPSL